MGCRAAPVLSSRGRDLGVQLHNADAFYIRLQNALFFIPIIPSFVSPESMTSPTPADTDLEAHSDADMKRSHGMEMEG